MLPVLSYELDLGFVGGGGWMGIECDSRYSIIESLFK